jgi:hypothetical protein
MDSTGLFPHTPPSRAPAIGGQDTTNAHILSASTCSPPIPLDFATAHDTRYDTRRAAERDHDKQKTYIDRDHDKGITQSRALPYFTALPTPDRNCSCGQGSLVVWK